jgi:YgiT-type zinc finger domain-containing protein
MNFSEEFAITQCPTCGSDQIKRVRRKWVGRSAGKSYQVPNLEFYECPVCGERVYDREAMRKIEAHSPVFTKPVRKKSA